MSVMPFSRPGKAPAAGGLPVAVLGAAVGGAGLDGYAGPGASLAVIFGTTWGTLSTTLIPGLTMDSILNVPNSTPADQIFVIIQGDFGDVAAEYELKIDGTPFAEISRSETPASGSRPDTVVLDFEAFTFVPGTDYDIQLVEV